MVCHSVGVVEAAQYYSMRNVWCMHAYVHNCHLEHDVITFAHRMHTYQKNESLPQLVAALKQGWN